MVYNIDIILYWIEILNRYSRMFHSGRKDHTRGNIESTLHDRLLSPKNSPSTTIKSCLFSYANTKQKILVKAIHLNKVA